MGLGVAEVRGVRVGVLVLPGTGGVVDVGVRVVVGFGAAMPFLTSLWTFA